MANREDYLGEFEQVVLLGLAAQSQAATGRDIYEHLKTTVDRDTSVTAIYVTLARLEDKGFVSSWVDDSDRRARRRYELEPEGIVQLRRSRKQFEMLWNSASLHHLLRDP